MEQVKGDQEGTQVEEYDGDLYDGMIDDEGEGDSFDFQDVQVYGLRQPERDFTEDDCRYICTKKVFKENQECLIIRESLKRTVSGLGPKIYILICRPI